MNKEIDIEKMKKQVDVEKEAFKSISKSVAKLNRLESKVMIHRLTSLDTMRVLISYLEKLLNEMDELADACIKEVNDGK